MSYKQALASGEKDKWQAAIKEELSSHATNKTWIVVRRNNNMNVIGSKWVFKKKRDANGAVQRYKARLVAKGYDQEYGIDFYETFAPVLKYKSLRMLVLLSLIYGYELVQLDIKTAFLNADIDEDLYMEVPDGVDVDRTVHVVKLLKALYGTKQAPKVWNDHINNQLLTLGFTRCHKDTCIYVRTSNTIIISWLVCLSMTWWSRTARKMKKNGMWSRMCWKASMMWAILGELNHILGMKITRSPGKVCMSQQLYVNDKLALYDMNECTSVSVPEATVKLVPAAKDDVITDRKEMSVYRGIIGSLIYASISTRPDITHAVNMLSRYMHTPSQTHMNAARRVLRYLKSCTEYGLVYDNGGKKNTMNDPLTITAYSDSDWGGDAVDSKSTTGYVVLLNGNLITWNTRKQHTVALSSAEAELMALVEVTKEVEWLSMLLGELHYKVKRPSVIFVDNRSAINMAQNIGEYDRSKHIKIKYSFIKEDIDSGEIKLQWVSTDKQLADIFTKALQGQLFIYE